MKKRILYKYITKPGIFIVYIVYVLWRKTNKQTNTHFEILGYFSQQIFFQKQKVAGMNLFVYAEAMWAFTFARLTWMFESERRERRVGVTVLDMSWDGKTGHRVGFIRITLTSNICFGRDLLHLKVDILSVLYKASIRGDSGCFIYVSVKKGDRDRAPVENAPCLFY